VYGSTVPNACHAKLAKHHSAITFGYLISHQVQQAHPVSRPGCDRGPSILKEMCQGINKVQFRKGLSIAAFMGQYGTGQQRHFALVASRWATGFVCPRCGCTRHCTFLRKGLQYWQCAACREQTTAICGTVFQATKLPLTNWCLAMHLLTQAKNNASAPELKRYLGVRYKTAWLMKHKLLQV